MKLNPLLCKSEGIRRLSIVVIAVSIICWAFYVAVETEGFTSSLRQPAEAIAVLIGYPVVVYLLMLALRIAALWVQRGFSSNNELRR